MFVQAQQPRVIRLMFVIQIAARPHPYNSHANDAVQAYLVGRVKSIVGDHEHVDVVEDLSSNAT
jgi:hypothetical protein